MFIERILLIAATQVDANKTENPPITSEERFEKSGALPESIWSVKFKPQDDVETCGEHYSESRSKWADPNEDVDLSCWERINILGGIQWMLGQIGMIIDYERTSYEKFMAKRENKLNSAEFSDDSSEQKIPEKKINSPKKPNRLTYEEILDKELEDDVFAPQVIEEEPHLNNNPFSSHICSTDEKPETESISKEKIMNSGSSLPESSTLCRRNTSKSIRHIVNDLYRAPELLTNDKNTCEPVIEFFINGQEDRTKEE